MPEKQNHITKQNEAIPDFKRSRWSLEIFPMVFDLLLNVQGKTHFQQKNHKTPQIDKINRKYTYLYKYKYTLHTSKN